VEVFGRFGQRFLLSLGEKGLTDIFLSLSSLEPQGFWVAELDGDIVGFVVGLAESRRLTQIIPRIVVKAMLGMYDMRFSRLNFLRMGIGHLLSIKRTSEAELLEIVVNDRHRSKGIGRKLMEFFLDYLQDRGARRVQVLVDDRYDVSKIFYEDKCGFKAIRKIETPSGEMVLLERGLS
jgi:ribosomal protein S18 acetylase RimI-like enzyme